MNTHHGNTPDTPQQPTTTLFNPRIRYLSTNDSHFDSCMDWRAELLMDRIDNVETDIIGGYVHFLTVRLGDDRGDDNVALILDALDADTGPFVDLFDGTQLDSDVEEQFAEPIHNVLIIVTAYLEPPLRGYDLAAWMVSEVIARMAGTIDTLVLLYPHPAEIPADYTSHLNGTTALNTY